MLRNRTLRGNTLANLAGRLVPGVLTVAVVPFLLPLIGTEAYGIVGVYMTLQVLLAIVEPGLTTTATREVARNVAMRAPAERNRTLARTLEVVYWVVGALIASALAGSAGWLATEWVNLDDLSPREVERALVIGGVAIGARWPIALYKGLLDGMQLQVTQSMVTLVAASIRILGAVGFVAWVSPTIVGFMWWQGIATALELIAMSAAAWRGLGGVPARARFELTVLRQIWRFAASLTLVSITGVAVAQVDKVVIGYHLPLKELGYYTLALTAAGVLPHIAAALAAAALPRFAGQLAGRDQQALDRTYRQTMHAVSFIVVWAAAPLAFFSEEILVLWTRSEAVADAAAIALTLLAVAYLANALYALPYTLALAAGRARIPLVVNVVSAPVVIVVTYILVPALGIVGAAAIWLVLMTAYLVIYGVWVHSVLLEQRFSAFLTDAALPYAALGTGVFGIGRLIASYTDVPAVSYVAVMAGAIGYGWLGLRLLPDELREVTISSLGRLYPARAGRTA